MNVEIQTTKVYTKNLKADTRYVFNPGGSRSSKTYSINQVAYTISAQSETPIIFSIVSETMPHLRKGAMRDFLLFLKQNNLYNEKYHNKSDNIYQVNKSIIEFFSVDTPGKVHGPERDYLFVNELQYISYDTFFHLSQRTRKRIFADWNPVSEFWVYPEYIENPQYKSDLTVIHSTLFDNPFIAEEIKRDILLRAERDPNYKRVYLEGLIGQLEGVVFHNWRYAEEGEIDKAFKDVSTGYGLDYGFHPDPDAMTKIAIDKRRKLIYCREMLYKTNNSTDDLIKLIQSFYRTGELIVAESATPRTNADLSKHFNIKPVQKTKTVTEWLRELQDYTFVIDKDSVNLVKEFRNYVWSDKKAGIPLDAWQHLIDGIRYFYMSTCKPEYF
ncbi:MAG: PBSX family phage terminase large subunit [Pedobacter sp.]|jgi:phage terminase large subunit